MKQSVAEQLVELAINHGIRAVAGGKPGIDGSWSVLVSGTMYHEVPDWLPSVPTDLLDRVREGEILFDVSPRRTG